MRMGTAKQEIQGLLDALPDDTSMEGIMERLWLKAKILRSIEQEERGELIPHEQVMEELDQWLQSLGHPPRATTSAR